MEGIMSAFKRLTLPVNHSRWSPVFSKMVQQVSVEFGSGGRLDLSLSERINLLRKLEPYIKQHSFTNNDVQEIRNAKEDLLKLWVFLLTFVGLVNKPALKELGYSIIVMLMQRDEFSLRSLGFGSSEPGPHCSKEELLIAKRYKDLLLRTFVLMVKSMTAKGKFAEMIHFSAQSLVVFFFRLPLVGGQVIDALQNKAASQRLEQTKSSNKSDKAHERLKESIKGEQGEPCPTSEKAEASKDVWTTDTKRTDTTTVSTEASSKFIVENPDLFEWNYFDSEAEAIALSPPTLSTESACFTWLSSKETFFLTFLEVYVIHVETVTIGPIEWQTIPAYNLLLECFWPLLKSSMWWDGICKRKAGESNGWVSSLPAYMRVKRSALAVLSNKAMINTFIQLTFECTNLYSLLSVDSCVEHLNLWFSTVAYSTTAREGIVNHNQNSRNTPPKQALLNKGTAEEVVQVPQLPKSFDYENYWFGIRNLLDSESFQVLLKVCSLIYNTLHLFRGQLRTRFIGDIMNEFFFRLFLHWSAEVRTFFQLTLVYKVLRADRRNLPCFSDSDVIQKYGVKEQEEQRVTPHSQRNHKRLNFIETKSSSSAAASSNSSGESGNESTISLPSSFERRMALFDDRKAADDEELLIDMMFCSKIDAYVRMCLENDPSIPQERRVYIQPSLCQYASFIHKYYKGITNETSETLPLLAHRMVYSEFQQSD